MWGRQVDTLNNRVGSKGHTGWRKSGQVWCIWEVEGQTTLSSSTFPCSLFSFTPSMPGPDNKGANPPMTWVLPSITVVPPPLAGYQGSFHSIQSCFPYGDCYRATEPAASRDGLVGDAHGFDPLRPNAYPSLSATLPAPGKLPKAPLP